MVWNTEPVRFFFFGHFVFFRAPAKVWWKKSDEKHRKKSTWPYRRFTRRADRRLPPGCYGNLIVNVKLTWSIAAKTCLWGRPRQTRLGHVHVHGYRRGTFLLYWNDERIVVLLKRVGSFLSISYKVTHFYASQPTSTIVRHLRVNATTHDWLRLSWTCPWPSKICPSCESPIILTMALNASKRGFIAKEYVTWWWIGRWSKVRWLQERVDCVGQQCVKCAGVRF